MYAANSVTNSIVRDNYLQPGLILETPTNFLWRGGAGRPLEGEDPVKLRFPDTMPDQKREEVRELVAPPSQCEECEGHREEKERLAAENTLLEASVLGLIETQAFITNAEGGHGTQRGHYLPPE